MSAASLAKFAAIAAFVLVGLTLLALAVHAWTRPSDENARALMLRAAARLIVAAQVVVVVAAWRASRRPQP